MPLIVRHIGLVFECGAKHRYHEAWKHEFRVGLKPDTLAWRKCNAPGCELIAAGIVFGLQSVMEEDKP